jgi:spore germination cell wall hydrolase CwlJ-like protein
LIPGIVVLLIAGGVAYHKGFLHGPVLTSTEAASQMGYFSYEEETAFLDDLSREQALPESTDVSQHKSTAARRSRIARNSFKTYVKSLSRKYTILVPYLRSQNGSASSLSELQCMALNLYFEARGEPNVGKEAVAHVVLNRVNHAGFPKSVCGVVKQGGEDRRYRCQFSWWCDGLSDRPRNKRSWRQSVILAAKVLLETTNDPTNGALWYHADYVDPYWRRTMEKGPKIGNHIFYSSKKSNHTARAS